MFIETLQKSIELNLIKDNRYLYLLDATKYENKKSVHIITYNDTLCKKDYEIGSKVFEYLGFSLCKESINSIFSVLLIS